MFTTRQKQDHSALAYWCKRRLRTALQALSHASRLGKLFRAALSSVGAQQAAELLEDTWLLWRCYVLRRRTTKGKLFR